MAAPAALVLLLVSAGLLAQPLGEDAPLTAAQAPEDRPFGGVLEADRNLLRSLRQADEFAADQRYQDAIVLWQQVLDRAGDSLVPDEGRAVRTFDKQEYHVYQSLAVEVERRLLELPPEALDLYRRSVDGAAAAVLADASRPYEERLTEIVRRFFLSSSGDDAAYGVACLKFDRGDFAGASRLLVRVLHEHPEPTTPREGALARLAIADARLGDTDRALRTADELRRVLAAGDPLRTLAEVAIKETHRREEASGGDARPLALGNPQRSGRMPAVAAASRVAQQTELWTRSVSPELVERPLDATDAGESRSVDFNPRAPLHSPKSLPRGLKPTLRGGGAAAGADATRTGVVVETAELAQGSDAATIAAWIEHGWSPAGQVLLSGSRAYFKGLERLVCCDAGTGRILWMGRRNRFELNWPSQFFGQAGASQSGGSRPTSLSDIQRFGDRVHAEMTLWEGVVYAIEGRPIDFGMEVPEEAAASPPTSRAVLRRLRTNRLSAYDATTGKLRWSRDAADEAEDVGFLAAPVPVGGRLLIPVTDEGELWLYSLQSDTGDTTWKVFLCDEPPGGCSPWSPVGTATEGGTVYVATGAGIVFAVDARTGSVQWAARYPRNGIRNLESVRPGAGAVVNPTLDGWDADVVIAVGRWLVVAPSDYGYLFVLDRRSGRLLWNTPRQPARGDPPADTLLGVLDGGVFVAGRNVVRRYDLAGGRLDWELTIGDSHGRGMLTDDAVCVPVGESIVRLDPADGHELSRSELFSPAREPVGNVYSDGARLLVLGPDRLYALTGLEAQLERLAGRVAVGEPAALLERMRLYDRLGQKAEAVADLEAAGELLAARSVDFNPREPLHSPESLPR
ncbi:MAG: PQQ-like beta-propeller repeat protein, partial [Planctomycetes bacterium]|nr:PQQ-like beta-propeller repeat protein [Planctomycetota bacterium]